GPLQYITVNGTPASGTLGNEFIEATESALSIQSKIYPNPTNGSLVNLNLSGFTGKVVVRITDATGRIVYNESYMAEESLNTVANFSHSLADGIYNVEFNAGENMVSERMVVKN
ncbi:MAG: T9SS type A sorting domain-containing protein, partial [Flavobacteriales bacterium]